MSTSLHQRRMTREEFFDWAEAREEPYEYDGLGPVAMTGGMPVHSMINGNIQFRLAVPPGRQPVRAARA